MTPAAVTATRTMLLGELGHTALDVVYGVDAAHATAQPAVSIRM